MIFRQSYAFYLVAARKSLVIFHFLLLEEYCLFFQEKLFVFFKLVIDFIVKLSDVFVSQYSVIVQVTYGDVNLMLYVILCLQLCICMSIALCRIFLPIYGRISQEGVSCLLVFLILLLIVVSVIEERLIDRFGTLCGKCMAIRV